MPSLRESVAAAGSGDGRAFDELFADALPRLIVFIRARVGGVVAVRESAVDLAQSVCREALEDLDSFEFRGVSEFRAWLFKRAVRKIHNRHRFYHRDRRDPAREQEALTESEAGELVTAYRTLCSPSRHASAREQLERIERALGELPAAQREAVALTRLGGMSYSDAADALQRTESAVRGLVLRGLARVAALLDDEDDAESGGSA